MKIIESSIDLILLALRQVIFFEHLTQVQLVGV
jgi:hypothetical protein